MTDCDPWHIESGPYGPKMVLSSSWSSEVATAWRSSGVNGLELNYAKGWNASSYDFLRDLPDIQDLEIIDWSAKDVSAVNDLKSLRRLKVFTYCRTELRFTEFPDLEECSLEWRAKASSLFEHQGLRVLFVNKYPRADLKPCSKMRRLERLSLASSRLKSLDGVEGLGSLQFLGIYKAPRLESLEPIRAMKSKLEILEVNDCRKIRSIAPVADLLNLRELHLCNDGDLETIRPLSHLSKLEKFLFYESTNIVDGDLSLLASLPSLKQTAFMERKHYSHARKDLPP